MSIGPHTMSYWTDEAIEEAVAQWWRRHGPDGVVYWNGDIPASEIFLRETGAYHESLGRGGNLHYRSYSPEYVLDEGRMWRYLKTRAPFKDGWWIGPPPSPGLLDMPEFSAIEGARLKEPRAWTVCEQSILSRMYARHGLNIESWEERLEGRDFEQIKEMSARLKLVYDPRASRRR